MTTGEYRVGIGFNPSGDDAVARLKQKAAAFIDECEAQVEACRNTYCLMTSPEQAAAERFHEAHALFERAMREAEGAAMWAVKAATKRPRT